MIDNMDKATAVELAVKEVKALRKKQSVQLKRLTDKQKQEILDVCNKYGVSESHINAVIMGYTNVKRLSKNNSDN